MYTYECRQDGKVWRELSVTTKAPMGQHEMAMYAEQYALGRQCNPDTVSIRCTRLAGPTCAGIDEARNVVDVRLSSALENRE